MKIHRNILVLLCSAVLLTSCATTGTFGALYTNVTIPGNATGNPLGTKVGTSKSTAILGLVATGDASIANAAKNGGITKVSHVDVRMYNILGLFSTYTTYVYGE